MNYLKVRTSDRTFLLQDTSKSKRFLIGVEVNKFGDEISGKGFDERLRLIELGAITSTVEMVMNPKYAELEEIKNGK